jgi:hypothetical protein
MPRKQVHVRDHRRRKPEQEEKIHVDEYTRTLETVVPRGNEREFLAAKRGFDERSEASKQLDLQLECKETGMIDDKELVKDWKKDPTTHDIIGVDDTMYGPRLEHLDVIRQVLRERFDRFSKASREIVHKAKVEVREVKKSKIPRKEKKKKIAKIKHEAKRELKAKAKKDLDELQETRKKARKARQLGASRKWNAERRRRAKYVAGVVGCSGVQADALIRRARGNGYEYDTVDWDQLQGHDLQFDERLGKLEHMVGRTYLEGEYEQVLESQHQQWNELMAERAQEIDRTEIRKGYVPEEYERAPEAMA